MQQPVAQQQTWQQTPGTAYNDPSAPLTPDGIAPIDYLNQIAPKEKVSFGFSRKQVAIVGGLILLGFVGFAIATVLQGGKPNISALSQQVTTKIGATTVIARESQKHLRSRELDALNSSLSIQLTNAGTGLTNAFTEVGIAVAPIKDAKVDDTSEETNTKLEEGRLNGMFDRVYAREMAYRLSTIMLQINTIYLMTDNAKLKEHLETTYKSFEPLRKQLEEYSATTS